MTQSFMTQSFNALLADPNLHARRVNVNSAMSIYEPTAPAEHVHFIHRGQIRLYQVDDAGNSRLVEILGPNEWFGAGALARHETYGLRAVAVGPTVVSEIPVENFLSALVRRPAELLEFTRQLAAKLQAAREQAAELIFRDTNQRLLTALLRFSKSAASTPGEDGGVVLNITHSQLAQAVGAARETISLALSQLRHQNLVRTGRNQLFFNPDALERVRGEFRSTGAMERVAAVA